jgi:hypothetical protein
MSNQAPISVSPAVADMVKIGKEAGGALRPVDLYCRTRKRFIASFCKVLSWGAVSGRVQPYYGRGVDLEEVRELRAAAEARDAAEAQGTGRAPAEDQDIVYIEAERTDGDQPEPLECIMLTGAPLHLDMQNLELKDFLLDSRSGARRCDALSGWMVFEKLLCVSICAV